MHPYQAARINKNIPTNHETASKQSKSGKRRPKQSISMCSRVLDSLRRTNVCFISSISTFMMQTIMISLCSLEGKPVVCLAVPEKRWSRSNRIEPKRNWQASGRMDDGQEPQTVGYDNLIRFTQRFTLHYELMEGEENTRQSIKTLIYGLRPGGAG